MASVAAVAQTELYLYGITLAGGAAMAFPTGVAGAGVEMLVEGPLAAVVTRLRAQKIRPQRTNLAAHHQVLRNLSDRQSVLPVAFGTIADGEEQLRDILRQNRSVLIARLQRLVGAVEMALKIFWETTNIFEFFVASHQELEQMRNQLFRPGRQPTLEEKMEVGRLFESLIEESRRRHMKRVTDAMAPYCVEIKTLDCSEQRMVVKLACLVEKAQLQRWEEGVEETARLFDNNYCFQYGGPFAPFNFAEVDLELA